MNYLNSLQPINIFHFVDMYFEVMKLEMRQINIIFFILLSQAPGVFNTNVFMGNRY